MSLPKHRSKGRGGSGRGQKSYRPGSSASPPPPTLNFANSDNGHTTDIFANKFMVYYVISNLGETARVQVQNGDIYEGVLKAVSSKFDCSLGEAHLVQQKKSNGLVIEDERILPSRDGLISTLVIALKDIVSVNITKTEEPEIVISVDSFTDAAIANVAQKQTNGQINERKLERWVPDGPDIGGGLEDNVKVNGWSADEMFKTNEEKFGVKSTYNEDLLEYTTPLPKDSTGEMELKAEQAAREIEQSRGHLHRQEVDSGKTEEEMYAAVVRPQTTSADPRTPQVSPGQSSVEGKPQREAAPETTQSSDERKATDTDTPAVQENAKPASAVTVNSENTVTHSSGGQSLKELSIVGQTASSDTQASGSKANHSEVVKDLKEFHSNFNLKEKSSKKAKDMQQTVPPEADQAEATVTKTTTSSVNESGTPSSPDVAKSEEKKDGEASILSTSKLNPLAKEFKFTPKAQKSTPPPQQYISVGPPPFSPTSIRAPVAGGPFPPHPQPMMVVPQIYRSKQPFNKPARSQSYGGGRDQGESPPTFLSAAAATGSPIITPGGGFPQQMYSPIPPHQPVTYVQPHAGMVPQPMLPQFVVPPGHGPARFIAPVSSPAGAGTVPMTQTYQDGTPVPVYVAGAPMQSAGTPQGQPQPSPSQSGQFVFSSPMPGQPQVGAPPQGQVTPGPAPYVYIPSVAPNAVPTSTPSSVSYMPGPFHNDRIQ